MNKPIGGYFSLELPQEKDFLHKEDNRFIALNTGRNCLEYVLRCRKYSKVYIPYYTCSVVMEPLQKLGVSYDYYHINRQFELAEEITLNGDEALLYTNYFGLKQTYVVQLAKQYGRQLVVDNTQAFYAKPLAGIDTFNTCRKFFGVPDGAYLYTDAKADFDIEQDVSYDRMSFLLKRLDLGAEAGYSAFREQTARLVGQPIKWMSKLTMQMMQGVDYEKVAKRRRENYIYLDKHLKGTNLLQLTLSEDAVPMVYPYLTDEKDLKKRLIAEKIFVATYWPNVLEWCISNDWEYQLADSAVFIPIDQRYDHYDMDRILEIINR